MNHWRKNHFNWWKKHSSSEKQCFYQRRAVGRSMARSCATMYNRSQPNLGNLVVLMAMAAPAPVQWRNKLVFVFCLAFLMKCIRYSASRQCIQEVSTLILLSYKTLMSVRESNSACFVLFRKHLFFQLHFNHWGERQEPRKSFFYVFLTTFI